MRSLPQNRTRCTNAGRFLRRASRCSAFANFSPRSPAKVNTKNATRGPLLLIAGGRDHTVPRAITKSTQKLYRKSAAVTDHKEFPDRGHSLTIDSGWRDVADGALDWLRQQSL